MWWRVGLVGPEEALGLEGLHLCLQGGQVLEGEQVVFTLGFGLLSVQTLSVRDFELKRQEL